MLQQESMKKAEEAVSKAVQDVQEYAAVERAFGNTMTKKEPAEQGRRFHLALLFGALMHRILLPSEPLCLK